MNSPSWWRWYGVIVLTVTFVVGLIVLPISPTDGAAVLGAAAIMFAGLIGAVLKAPPSEGRPRSS